MSKDINKWYGIGRIGKDLELKFVPSGDAVLNFSLACGDDYKNKQGEKVEKTNWIDLVAFGKSAENITKYCKQGSKLYVEGKLTKRKWQTKEGENRYSTEVVVTEFQFLDSRGDKPESQPAQQQSAPSNQAPAQFDVVSFDDLEDLPF